MGLLATFGLRVLEAMFVLGWLGSMVVLVLTGIEDVETLVEVDETSDH